MKMPATINPAEMQLEHGRLTLTCTKCTRTESFHAAIPVEARTLAKRRGWVWNSVGREGERRLEMICPYCPAIRGS